MHSREVVAAKRDLVKGLPSEMRPLNFRFFSVETLPATSGFLSGKKQLPTDDELRSLPKDSCLQTTRFADFQERSCPQATTRYRCLRTFVKKYIRAIVQAGFGMSIVQPRFYSSVMKMGLARETSPQRAYRLSQMDRCGNSLEKRGWIVLIPPAGHLTIFRDVFGRKVDSLRNARITCGTNNSFVSPFNCIVL